MSGPDLSVIMVTWNVASLAEIAVRRVLERAGTLDVEVLVVDNDSPDGTADTLRARFGQESRVRVLDAGANLGFPRANNLALGEARGRHVLFLNPDTEVGVGTLEACVAELDRDPGVGVVGCRLETPDGQIQVEGARQDYRLRHLVFEGLYLQAAFPRNRFFAHQVMGDFAHTTSCDVEAVSGAFLMTRRSVALALGGLPDALFMYHEDLSYCLRARRAGWTVRYRGDVATLHRSGASSSRSPAPLELLEGEVRVRLIRERGGLLAVVAARMLFAVRQICRLALSLPFSMVPPLRRRYPQVANVSKQTRLLLWTVWPRGVWRALERAGVPRDRRPRLLIIGPTPPPVHGVAVYIDLLSTFLPLRAEFRVDRVDTSDRRSIDNLGRVDAGNVILGLLHLAQVAGALFARPPALTYIPVSQNGPAFLRDALFVALAWARGSRVILHLHGAAFQAFYEGSGRLLQAVIRLTHQRVHAVWVLGDGLRSLYAGLVSEERIRVVPNGVPDPAADAAGVAFNAGPVPHGPEEPFHVLYLGNLMESKGAGVLLEAVRALHEEGMAVRLHMAGGWGTNRDRAVLEPVMARMRDRGLVEAHGIVGPKEKARLLERAQVFVLASVAQEGQPLSILEAMAAGLPVVATPQGAVADMVVDGETGILVPPGDAAALAQALRSLLEDGESRRRLGVGARRRFESRFTATRALTLATRELSRAVG